MRVVIVNDYGDVNGGAAKVAILSAAGLARAGIPVTFFCAVPPLNALLSQEGIRVECLDIPDVWTQPNRARAAAQGIWNPSARTKLGELLARLSPGDTVVHFHHWTKALSPSVLAAATGAGFPTLITLHDYFSVCPNGIYYDFQRAQPCVLRPLSLRCMARHCDRNSYLQKTVRIARQATTNFAVGRHPASLNFAHVSTFARSVVEPYLWSGVGHFLLPNPVDVERHEPAPVRRNREFVFVGRFAAEKGCALLAEAARVAGVPVTYAGRGDLEPTIRTLNPAARIVPWAGPTELVKTLRRARALVFPSLWYETAGLAVSEALALGLPVIASRSTGAADLIEPGRNGLLFDPGSLTQLVDCLRQLCDADVAARMGAAGFDDYWREAPTVERHVEVLRDIYRSLLKAHPPASEPDLSTRTPSDRPFDLRPTAGAA